MMVSTADTVASGDAQTANLALHSRWTADENRQELTHLADYMHASIEVHQPGADPVVGIAANIRSRAELGQRIGQGG